MMYVNRGWIAIAYLTVSGAYGAIEVIYLEPYYNPSTIKIMDTATTISLYIIGTFHAFYIAYHFNKHEDLRWYSKIIPPLTVVLLPLIITAILIRTFLNEPFSIPSGSMEPTFPTGDIIYAKKSAYGYSKYAIPFILRSDLPDGRIYNKAPERGDVVVLTLPENPKIDYLKRIIGMPGDTIQMIRGELYINNQKIEHKKIEPYQLSNDKLLDQYIETLPNGRKYKVLNVSDNEYLDNTPLYTVPEKHYFMMGDNRDNSSDSRVFGAVHEDYLIGMASIQIKDGRTNQYVFRSVEKE